MTRATLILMAVALVAAGRAEADIVVANSTYGAVLFDHNDGTAFATLTVNGIAQDFMYHGVDVTVTEAEVNLGGGNYKVTIDFSASQDIFPNTGATGDYGFVNIGTFTQPLQLTAPRDLTHVFLTYTNGGGGIVASGDVAGLVPNRDPWDGFFAASGVAGAFSQTTAVDVQDIKLEFDLAPASVPEPGSFTLLGLVIVALLGVRLANRRRCA